MAADAEATLPSLIEAIKKLITADRKQASSVDRGAKLAAVYHQTLQIAHRHQATYAWDAESHQHSASLL